MRRLAGYSVEVLSEEGRRYAWHQVETPRKFQSADVVFNTYPTGTGKTRALLNAIHKLEIERALIVAPINELIRQYERSVREFVEECAMPHEVYIVTSESLEEMDSSSHSRALRSILAERKKAIVITNPDIVFYVIMQRFGSTPAVQRPLIVDLFQFPQLVAFDEFHYYDLSRIFFVFVLMATARQFGLKQKYLFMTATPNEYLCGALKRSGLAVEVIKLDENPGGETTPVASPIDVEVLEGNLDAHQERLCNLVKEHLREYRDILVISDSLSRIAKFGMKLREEGIDFGMVTGPMDVQSRSKSLQKGVILATPTVDVGYDFSRPSKERQGIDTIIFEARDSDTLIQRLGRAGRVFGKCVTDQPSSAYLLVSSRWYKKVSEALERSATRLEFAQELKRALPGPLENLKKEYLGPYRLVLGFYEDAFSLLFPRDYTDLLNEYFSILEAMFGLKLRNRGLWRNELDFYYLSRALERGKDEVRLCCMHKESLLQLLQKKYNEDSLSLSCKTYRTFIERFILAFRSSFTEGVYVRDPKKISGSSEFIYDKLSILTQYLVRRLGASSIPQSYRHEAKEAFELIEPLETATEIVFKVGTDSPLASGEEFFIPLKLWTQCFGDVGSIDLAGTPVYRISSREGEYECHSRNLRVLWAYVNGHRERILIGKDALKAVSYLSERPWECDLFPR